MATTCSFGQLKDIRLTKLFVKGKIVVDDENINAKDVEGKELIVKNDLKITGNLTVGGIINYCCIFEGDLQTGVENLPTVKTGITGSVIYEDVSPPPSNYTTHYGPTIQCVEKYNDIPIRYTGSSLPTEVRNGGTWRYIDFPLNVTINKHKALSKIKITVCICGEFFENSVLVIRRFNQANTYLGEVRSYPNPPSVNGYGIMAWPYDTDLSSTPNMVTFSVLDTEANTKENYTYVVRLYQSNTNDGGFNRAINSSSWAYEYGSSRIFLEEVQ